MGIEENSLLAYECLSDFFQIREDRYAFASVHRFLRISSHFLSPLQRNFNFK